jgi:hypothetical protein
MCLLVPEFPVDFATNLGPLAPKFKPYVAFVFQRCRIEGDDKDNMVKLTSTQWLLPSCITTKHSKGHHSILITAILEEILHKHLGSISTLPRR